MKILFIADIVGVDALDMILDILPRLRNHYQIDFTIANVENTDKGKGILGKQVERLKEGGMHCLTSGNHIWDPRKKDVLIKFAAPHKLPGRQYWSWLYYFKITIRTQNWHHQCAGTQFYVSHPMPLYHRTERNTAYSFGDTHYHH